MKTKPRRSTILVVDDHEENIKVLANILSVMGYDIIPAMTAAQAMTRLEHSTPDLILLDIILPDRDGITVCQEIQKNTAWSDVPIIFLSAADDKGMVVKALESGGVDYITKPFNKAELISRVRTHLALKDARDHLADLAEDKDELLRMLTHDLKNHVAGVQMGAAILLSRINQEMADDRSIRLLENLQDSSARMLGFIESFLANQAGLSADMEVVEVDLRHVLDHVVADLEPLAIAKKLSIRIADAPGGFAVRANAEGTYRVIENLIANSIKFCPEGAEIHAKFRESSSGSPALILSDTGPGFSDEDRENAFQRYTRLSAQPTAGEPSTGLGLFIVKRMMAAMGGTVEILEADGAVFQLTFQKPKGGDS